MIGRLRIIENEFTFSNRRQVRGRRARPQLLKFGNCAGPMLRASGIQWNLRKVDHYECYDSFDWQVQSIHSLSSTTHIHARIGDWGSIQSFMKYLRDQGTDAFFRKYEYFMVGTSHFLALNRVRKNKLFQLRGKDSSSNFPFLPIPIFWILASLIPFIEHNDANRACCI